MEVGADSHYSVQLERYSVSTVIRWGEDMSVGHALLDEQHRAIFDLLAEAQDLWRRGEGVARLHPLLTRLGRLLENHFPEEERMLAEVRYPKLPEHAAEHAKTMKELKEVCERFKSGPDGGGVAPGWVVLDFILRVAVGHVLASDAGYVGHVAQAGGFVK